MADQPKPEFKNDRATCTHGSFISRTLVERTVEADISSESDPDLNRQVFTYRCDLQVACSECGEPFQFAGAFPDPESKGRRVCMLMFPVSRIPAETVEIPGTGIRVDKPDPRFKRVGPKPFGRPKP